MKKFNTMFEAITHLNNDGFSEQFKSDRKGFKAINSDTCYAIEDLKVVSSHVVSEKINPSVDDSSKIFAIEATDGTKGTIVITDATKHFKNAETIEALKRSCEVK